MTVTVSILIKSDGDDGGDEGHLWGDGGDEVFLKSDGDIGHFDKI